MRAAGEHFQLAETDRHLGLSHRTDSLAKWLGRKDSNLRIRDPKSRALPLGHAPSHASLEFPAAPSSE
jgi:hypothetical protein